MSDIRQTKKSRLSDKELALMVNNIQSIDNELVDGFVIVVMRDKKNLDSLSDKSSEILKKGHEGHGHDEVIELRSQGFVRNMNASEMIDVILAVTQTDVDDAIYMLSRKKLAMKKAAESGEVIETIEDIRENI